MKLHQFLSDQMITDRELTMYVVPTTAGSETRLLAKNEYTNIQPGDYKLLLLDFLELIYIPGTAVVITNQTGGIYINKLDNENYIFSIVNPEGMVDYRNAAIYSMAISQHSILGAYFIYRNTGRMHIRKLLNELRIKREIINMDYLLALPLITRATATHTGSFGSGDHYTGIHADDYCDLEGNALKVTSGKYSGSVQSDFFTDKLPKVKPFSEKLSVLMINSQLHLTYVPKYKTWCVNRNLVGR